MPKRLYIFLLFVASVGGYSQTASAKESKPERYLIEYLISQGYVNFTTSFLGDQPKLKIGYSLKQVDCAFEINRCKVMAESVNKKRVFYWFRVNSQELGWQSTRTISAGEEVNESDFRWGMTDALTCSNQLAKQTDLRANSKTVVRLRAGDSLCRFDLIAIDDVRKGDWAMMTSQTDSFELNIRVKALKAGSVGDVIPVRIPSSSSVLNGVVTEKGKVELIP
ncbi:flagellar basal body P-ring formation chaperone FlgA [Enterovibrio norvegicus]|uniref:Flagella basal body P-ring formation protein FlgA n=1 Tax=Enterovibrio norvegicus TaxID=188144 RepID=A0ABV4L618_9GAMM|nr:flagellar basal body P-ring formation chaperone FlgA [Enterovibrio norvegicus]OEF55547.1 flagella basal body P-ring formation protein FlgA [Enterovibrio norvegicus]